MAKKKKVRVDLRKNRTKPPRQRNWTRGFHEHGFDESDAPQDERVRARGELSRRRTIIQEERPEQPGGEGPAEMPAVDMTACLAGRGGRVPPPVGRGGAGAGPPVPRRRRRACPRPAPP